jgi:hypothetical protein
MKHLAFLPVVFLLVCAVRPVHAAPVWGTNCQSCHNHVVTDKFLIFGEDKMADPVEHGAGLPDQGSLPTFRASRGRTTMVSAEVLWLDAEDLYAVEVKRLRHPGVEHGGILSYTGDCEWSEWSDPGNHFTDPAVSYRWGDGPTRFAFEITVDGDTPIDYYHLVFAVAGVVKSTGELFYQEEHFYLQVDDFAQPGDMDEDGDLDLQDFAAFADCLAGQVVSTPPFACEQYAFDLADIDNDDDVDLQDFSYLQMEYAP